MLDFHKLYDRDNLVELDMSFQSHIYGRGDLLSYMITHRNDARVNEQIAAKDGFSDTPGYSTWLIEMGIAVQEFLSGLFSGDLVRNKSADDLAIIYECNDRFVRRRSLATFRTPEDLGNFDGINCNIAENLGEWSELSFAKEALRLIDNDTDDRLDLFMRYAAWAVHSGIGQKLHKNDVVFIRPAKINHEQMFPSNPDGNFVHATNIKPRDGFALSDNKAFNSSAAGYHANYCIFCHKRKKDSCSKGLTDNAGQMKSASDGSALEGCALSQKISEMNYLKSKGYDIGALAVIVVNNPMCAGTGHRICNDCSRACVYQTQDPVDIPLIETNILNSVLAMSYGFEIYSLLTRWNPLNITNPLPKPATGKRVLVSGMGPAGYTLAHYLINEGHEVVGIDGAKIEPLPIRNHLILDAKSEIFESLDMRVAAGFGGVSEYGITVRWNKNYLKIIRMLLERRENFRLFDGIALGCNLSIREALEQFDHVSIACGAGRPKTLNIPNSLACGVRYASDFLMNLQLGGPYRRESICNLQIRMPVVVIGGGLTAVDAATEALAYYPAQVKKFKEQIASMPDRDFKWDAREQVIVDEFCDQILAKSMCTLAYRGAMTNSPAYKLNPHELRSALEEGVQFMEHAELLRIDVDRFGDVESLLFKCGDNEVRLPARTVIIAIGTEKHLTFAHLDKDMSFDQIYEGCFANERRNVSLLGDLNPKYSGSVVKAMASARDFYQRISQTINITGRREVKVDEQIGVRNVLCDWSAEVVGMETLSAGIIELRIRAPMAARKFRPGQFYKLQNYYMNEEGNGNQSPPANGFHNNLLMEGVALTGYKSDGNILSLIVLEAGSSTKLIRHLSVGIRVFCMGPLGEPTFIPKNETVMLVGGGLGNITALALGKALKQNNCKVLYFAGYRKAVERVKIDEQEEISDIMIWACEESVLSTKRTQDFSYHGNIIQAISAYNARNPEILESVDRAMVIGSCGLMQAMRDFMEITPSLTHNAVMSVNAPMQCMLKGLCGQCVQKVGDRIIFACAEQDQDLFSVDFSVLQARLRQNSVQEKISAMWLGLQSNLT